MSFVQNLVGFVKKSSFSKVGKSDTYNMIVETKDQTEHGFSIMLRPMPGYETVCKVPAGSPQGLFRCSRSYDGKPGVYGVWGRTLYFIDNGSPVYIGRIAGSGKVSFCETSGYGHSHVHLVVCDGVNLYCVDTEISPSAQADYFKAHSPIKMPFSYPDSTTERVTPSWIAYLYGYLVMGAAGTDIFYTSYQYPFENRNESGTVDYDIFEVEETSKNEKGEKTGIGYGNFFFSEWQPDNTIVGCSNGSRLFTLGERSFQVFSFQNSKEIPFSSPDTASMPIGIRGKDTLAQFGSSIFWLGSSDMGVNTVFTMGAEGNPSRISTDEIEDLIASYDKDSATAFCMRVGSHPMYIISFPVDGISLGYDIKEGGWVRLGSSDGKGHERHYRYTNAVVDRDDRVLLQCDGALVRSTQDDWYEHDGTPILRKRVGGAVSSDHKPFKVNKVQLLTNNGDYRNYVGTPAKIAMRYSRDGVTFLSLSTKSIGRAGQYGYDVSFRNLGKSTYFTIEVGSSDNIPFALYGIDIDAVRTN